MQFAVINTSFAVMGYKQLHGVTWRYMVSVYTRLETLFTTTDN
jgi:hypothetical protein